MKLISVFIILFLASSGIFFFSLNGFAFLAQEPKKAQPPPPVPVFEPEDKKKPSVVDKKESLPPVVKTAEPDDGGLLPGKFIRNRIENMTSSGFIPVTGLKVDTNRKCWINPYQNYSNKTDKNIVLITKDEYGYHVVLEGIDHQWEATDFDNTGWLPIKSVKTKK